MALTKCLIFFVKCRQSGDYVKEIGCLTFPSSYQSYHLVSKLSSRIKAIISYGFVHFHVYNTYHDVLAFII